MQDHKGLIKILRDQSGIFWTCLGNREPIKVIQTKSGLNGTKLRAIREHLDHKEANMTNQNHIGPINTNEDE